MSCRWMFKCCNQSSRCKSDNGRFYHWEWHGEQTLSSFLQLAHDYFLDENAGGQLVNSEAECQLNYVIVIGDGAMKNTGVLNQEGSAAGLMERLRRKGS